MKAKQLGVGGEDIFVKMVFKDKNNSLNIGTPIEFKSFQVGSIVDIENRFNKKSRDISSTIYALIHKKAFDVNSTDEFISLIKDGLKARVSSNIPFIGLDHIELFFGKALKKYSSNNKKYIEVPTVKLVKGKNILDNLNDLVLELKNLPLKELLDSTKGLIDENRKPINELIKHLDSVVKRFATTVSNLNRFTSNREFLDISKNINNLLGELELTLLDIQKLTSDYGENSRFGDQLSLTLESISEASRSFDKTNKILQRNPNALVVGDN
jgi:paraquat-inducible protein B